MTTGGATTGLAPAAGLGTEREASLSDYWQLLKPRIMLLIVITTIGSLALAAHGWPGTSLAIWTVLGMAFVSGGSSAINHWYDRDIDALHGAHEPPARRQRTRGPTPRSPWASCSAGPACPCSRSPSTGWRPSGRSRGFACYVFVYTVWLKRRTPQNIVIGGAAGRGAAARRLGRRDGSVSAPPSRSS